MDRRQKFRVLSMKRTLFVDKRDSVGLRKDLLFLDTTDRVPACTVADDHVDIAAAEAEAVGVAAVRA